MTSACRNLPSGADPIAGPAGSSNGTRWIAGGRAGRNPGLGHLAAPPAWRPTPTRRAGLAIDLLGSRHTFLLAPDARPEPRSRPHSVHTGSRRSRSTDVVMRLLA
jgi:hypothetical protein